MIREAENIEYSAFENQGIFEYVNATDSDNPYNINGVKKFDPKSISTVTAATAATSGVFS